MGKVWSQTPEAREKIRQAKLKLYRGQSELVRCKKCGKEYRVALNRIKNGRGKYCSKNCQYEDKKGVRYSPATEFKKGQKPWCYVGLEKKCFLCGKIFSTKPSADANYCSRSCVDKSKVGSQGFWRGKKREDISNEKNGNWKGEEVGYFAEHMWVSRKMGKPKICFSCGTTTAKRYEWATRHGGSGRKLEKYIRLCKKCHNDYDGVNIWQQTKK